MVPEDRARLDRQREHVVRARDHEDHAVVNDRLSLAGKLRRDTGPVQMRTPHAFQRADVGAIDAIERRITLVCQVAAVRRPARARRSGKRLRGEGRVALRERRIHE